MTDVHYENQARENLLKGAEALYNAVRTTLGPRGRNVVISRGQAPPVVTHDGVTVARAVSPKDENIRPGAELIKAVANKMNTDVGDGTTTVTVLTYHIMKEAKELIDKGASPMQLSSEVEEALSGVIRHLDTLKEPVTDLESLTRIATISAGDEELGRTIAETLFKIGKAGTVTVEPSSKPVTEVEMTEGFHIGSGFASPFMATDERGTAQYDKPAIIVVNQKLHTFREILPLLEKVDQTGNKWAVVIAEDFGEDCLQNLILNNLKGTFKTLAVYAPWYEDRQRAILDDIAASTGATVISNDTISISQATTEHFGTADRVISNNLKTTMLGCGGDPEGRIKQLKEKLKTAEGADKEHLEIRIAAIAGQVATIRVGGTTETEIEEKQFRVDDAVAATRAALDTGILPGGAVALYRAPIKLDTPGARLLAKVLKEPFKQLMENSNIDVKKAESMLTEDYWQGINVKTGEAVDLKAEGIIDPYAVTAEALKTAASLGVIGMTAGALVIEEQ